MCNRNLPSAGEFYRHFKGNLYQIIGIAKHSETMEQMVVYQALYGDYALYTRPLDMFLSLVDKEKYPDAVQEYRFEKVVPGEPEVKTPVVVLEKKSAECADTTKENAIDESKSQLGVSDADNDNDEETVRPEILRFLDAEGAEAKLKVLRELRMDLDSALLTTIEVSLDLLPDDKESLERRYDFVERTLEQRIRFEGGRLR